MRCTLPRHAPGLLCLALAFSAACINPHHGPAAQSRVPATPRPIDKLNVDERLAILKRAHVWRPIETTKLDLLAGPAGPGAVPFNRVVDCTYDFPNKPLSGLTPKFECAIGHDDTVKVKYGKDNGEVYAEVAATRLFWALGFAADRMYPVGIRCHQCPDDPFRESRWEWHLGKSTRVTTKVFDPAVIERDYPGEKVEVDGYDGVAWREVENMDEESGGASRAHVDALKLLAVFVQHVDNKPSQQALVCPPDALGRDRQGNAICAAPMLVLKDLGATFGGDRRFAFDKMHLAAWRALPVWRDEPGCVGQLRRSFTGSLGNPPISEAGRRFLAARLALLTDRQIRDLFVAARVERRGETVEDAQGRPRPVTADDWAVVFKEKRDAIAGRRCPV
jgi:hypothetical protein